MSSALLGSIGSSQLDCWHQLILLTCLRRPQDVFHLHVCHRRLDSSGLRARLLCLGGPDQPREVKTLQTRRSQYYAHIRHYPHAAVLEIGKLLGRAAQVQNAGGAISNAGGRRKICGADTSLSCANMVWEALRWCLQVTPKVSSALASWSHQRLQHGVTCGHANPAPKPSPQRLPAAQVQSDSSDILLRGAFATKSGRRSTRSQVSRELPQLSKIACVKCQEWCLRTYVDENAAVKWCTNP